MPTLATEATRREATEPGATKPCSAHGGGSASSQPAARAPHPLPVERNFGVLRVFLGCDTPDVSKLANELLCLGEDVRRGHARMP